MKLSILNTREIKSLMKLLKEQYGFEEKLDYVFLKSEKNKIYIISRDLDRIDLSKLKINSIGLYLGELKDSEFRLSLEGSQIIGPKASKNVVLLNEGLLKLYFSGHNFEIDLEGRNRFVILKYGDNFIGCAKYKEGKIFNFLPKEHRSEDLIY